MKIVFLGYGNVGAPLADHLQRLGHNVTLAAANANTDSIRKATARNAGLAVAPPKEALASADVVFLATPFQANEEVLKDIATELKGKILVACTNPVGPGITHGLKSVTSGSETVQNLVPEARVVKAFSIYGYENFEDNAHPDYGVKPAMLFCGNDAGAKRLVAGLIEQLGWEALDVGGLEQALHLEHMTLLWVRMVRVHGASPHLVYAALRR